MTDAIKILLIDDSEDDRQLYRRALGKNAEGAYSFTEAADGEEGLQQIEKMPPDCVLLDYSLPGRNGVEVLKRIRAKYSFVPVVMLTGQGNENVAVAAIKEGAQDYIVKSAITPEALERVVRVAIEHAKMERRIVEQRASLEIFAHALAHDLKEPTNTVRSFLELIQANEPLSDKGKLYFSHVQKASLRMQQLIDTVHLYTRIDVEEKVQREECSLGEALADARENLSQLIATENAAVAQGTLPKVTANKTQLTQLLQNLIANAIRHGGAGVTIHVGAEEKSDHWQVRVKDNGPGIEPQHLEKIFEPFKRMSNAKERGLGMGLAICRKVVESHGGKIWCESKPGDGATFVFTWPKLAAPPDAQPVEAGKKEVTVISGGQLARILLVDDSEADMTLSRIMLIEQSHLKCEVLAAGGGREALKLMQDAMQENNPVDLVLLDINMPMMSGFEMLAEMHKRGLLPHSAVVMCSTSAYDMDQRMALDLGASGYLTKPPQFAQFKSIVENGRHVKLKRDGDAYALLRAA